MPSTPEGRTTLPCWWGGRCGRIQAEASGLSDLMAAPDLVILSTRVVTGEGIRPAAVAIADGVITAVHEHGGPPDAARQLDVGDAALLPRVVDTHLHVNEPGRTEWGIGRAPRLKSSHPVISYAVFCLKKKKES